MSQAKHSKHYLVVSVHDLSTITWKICAKILEDLAHVGVPVTSLLLIPDHHHQGRIDCDSDFSKWICQKTIEGHEPVLHGFYHQRSAKPRESFLTKIMTQFYTAGEGEFYDLDFEEAWSLLHQGRQCIKNSLGALSASHLSDRDRFGFIAPAWLLGSRAEMALKEIGFSYTTRIDSIIDFVNNRQFSARSMVYSVRRPWRRWMSLLWNEMLFHILKTSPLLRISLHPQDWAYDAIRSHALQCIRQATAERQVLTYKTWLTYAS